MQLAKDGRCDGLTTCMALCPVQQHLLEAMTGTNPRTDPILPGRHPPDFLSLEKKILLYYMAKNQNSQATNNLKNDNE